MNTAWNAFNFSLPPLSAQGREEGKEFRLGKPGTQPLKKMEHTHCSKHRKTGSKGGIKSGFDRHGDTKQLIAGVHLCLDHQRHTRLKKRHRACWWICSQGLIYAPD